MVFATLHQKSVINIIYSVLACNGITICLIYSRRIIRMDDLSKSVYLIRKLCLAVTKYSSHLIGKQNRTLIAFFIKISYPDSKMCRLVYRLQHPEKHILTCLAFSKLCFKRSNLVLKFKNLGLFSHMTLQSTKLNLIFVSAPNMYLF